MLNRALSNPPRRLRYSLRTLFVAVTVLCLWLGYHVNWIRERRAVLASPLVESQSSSLVEAKGNPGAKAPWSLRLLGESGYNRIHLPLIDKAIADRCGFNRYAPESSNWERILLYMSVIDRQELERVQRLFPEANVYPAERYEMPIGPEKLPRLIPDL